MQKITFLILLALSCTCLKAQTNLDSLYAIWQDDSQDDSTRVSSYKTYIWEGFLYNKPDSAFVLAEALLAFGQEKQSPNAKSAAYYIQAASSSYQDNYIQALDYYQRSLKIFEELGIKKSVANSLYGIGNSYYSQSNFTQALDYYQRSLKIRKEIRDKQGIASSLNNIGLVNELQGNYPLALDYYQRSLKIREKIGNKQGIARSLNSIGNVYYDQGNYPQAQDHYQRSLKLYEEIGDKRGIATSLNNIGSNYKNQDNYSKALDYYQRSLKIQVEIEDKWGIAYSLNDIGSIYKKQENHPLALDYFQRSRKIREEIGDISGLTLTLSNIGNIYLEQDRYNEAIVTCQRALSLGEEIGTIYLQKEPCSCMYEANKGLGKSTKALEYHEQLTILNDSLFNEESTKKLTQLSMQYDFDKQEAATEMEQEKKDAVAAQELKQRKLERNGFIGGFAVVLLFAGVFFRQRNRIGKEKERSEELLMNILPKEVAEELKAKGHSDAQLIDHVTVLFTDFKGFTALSEQLSPKELVADLHTCFSEFDRICEKYGIEKIKTIGDAYMAAGGLPTVNNTHALDVVKATLEMAEVVEKAKAEKTAANHPFFEVRIGVHTGPVVAGIVGVKKFQYDIWGDTVNTASRMESSGDVGKVNISEATYEMLKDNSEFVFESRGKIAAKGKGEMEMFFVSTKNISN